MLKLESSNKVNNSLIKTYSLFDRFLIVVSSVTKGYRVTITPMDKTEVLHLNDVMMIKEVLHTNIIG